MPGTEPSSPAEGEDASPVTRLLRRISGGDEAARNELLPLVYDELRALAGAFFRTEREGHTLQPTAIVHEAWLRLAGSPAGFASRRHFMAIAGTTMRRVLVDHARARGADKRGSDWARVTLDGRRDAGREDAGLDADVLSVHEALERLAALDPRQARIVEMRWFGGLTVPEVAEELGLVPRTVEKDWTMARAWLARELDPKRR